MDPTDDPVLDSLPKALQTALKSVMPEARSWPTGIATYAIGLFLWVGFFDQVGARTLAIGGLTSSILGALIAGFLCFILLFLAPALWGRRSGQPMLVVAASTFGTNGAPFVPGLLIAIAQVIWFGVTISLALHFILQGLVHLKFLDGALLEPMKVRGLTLESPLVLVVGLFWSYSTAVIGSLVVKLVVALNRVFPIIPALMLGVITLLLLRTTINTASGIDPVSALPVNHGSWRSILAMITLIGGFFAMTGVGSIDWGRASLTDSDVNKGGLLGVIFAPAVILTLGLLSIAGTVGQNPPPASIASWVDAEANLAREVAAPSRAGVDPEDERRLKASGGAAYRFEPAVTAALGTKLGGAALIIFGLAGLTPACYAASSVVSQVAGFRKRPRRIRIGTYLSLVAYPVIALRGWSHLEVLFCLMGVVFAPVCGSLSGDFIRNRGQWPGISLGWNLGGLLAWSFGLITGVVPTVVGFTQGWPPWPWWLAGYFVAFSAELVFGYLVKPLPIVPPPVID